MPSMECITRIIDPDGDILLVLMYAKYTRHIGEEADDARTPYDVDAGLDSEHESLRMLIQTSDLSQDGEIPWNAHVRMLLSSKHLTLASPYFRAALKTHQATRRLGNRTFRLVPAFDWNVEAFTALMNIIHSRPSPVPRAVCLEFLADFAAIVDLYQCHEAVWVFVDMWQQKLLRVPVSDAEDGGVEVDRLEVAWSFGSYANFRRVVRSHLFHARDPFPVCNTRVPREVTDILGDARAQGIKGILAAISKAHQRLAERRVGCSHLCSAVLLGTLSKFEWDNGLRPQPTAPYVGLSVAGLCAALCEVREPVWYDEQSGSGVGPAASDGSGDEDGDSLDEAPSPVSGQHQSARQQHMCRLADVLEGDFARIERSVMDAEVGCFVACSLVEGGHRFHRIAFSGCT